MRVKSTLAWYLKRVVVLAGSKKQNKKKNWHFSLQFRCKLGSTELKS
jgi:hypothetical protein